MDLTPDRQGRIPLPDGRTLVLTRPRSAGPLGAAALAACRQRAVPLAFDPAQSGWVPLACEDDLDPATAPRGRPGLAAAVAVAVAPAGAGTGADAGTGTGTGAGTGAGTAPPRLGFRPWRAEDLPAFVALLDDPRVWAHLPEPWPAPLTAETARGLIALSGLDGHHEVRAVEADGRPAGQLRLAFGPTPDGHAAAGEAELSYWFGAGFWGRGIASAAVARHAGASFARHPGLAALVARVHEANPASARVLAKAGFRETGRAAGDPAIRVFRLARPDPARLDAANRPGGA